MRATPSAPGSPACAVAVAGLGWLALAAPAAAAPRTTDRPRTERVWETVAPALTTAPVNSHVIYLNRCAGECMVVQGTTNATSDPVRSSLGHGVLSPFSRGDAVWNTVVECMRDVFAPFAVE